MSANLYATQEELQIHQLPTKPPQGLAEVYFDGQRIWSFATDTGRWEIESHDFIVSWPAALKPHLSGSTEIMVKFPPDNSLKIAAPQPVVLESTVQFDDSAHRVELRDPLNGFPRAINKWGRLARSFDHLPEDLLDGLFQETAKLITFLQEQCHIDAFITGGTLLGAVRNGELLPHDDDADLAYLSTADNPSDVVLESYAIEHKLREAKYDIVRHSSGHLQVLFPGHQTSDTFYIDIFSYFNCEGWFYGTFHARELTDAVKIHPLKPLSIHSYDLPAPASPESLLASIYGPHWQTPDPGFQFITPPPAKRRYYWWLNHFDAHREDWEDFHRWQLTQPNPEILEDPVTDLTPILHESVLDLGCGLGSAARYYAHAGKNVLGIDYSRPAILAAEDLNTDHASSNYVLANLYDTRDVMRILKTAAQLPGKIDLVAHRVLDGVHWLGRDNILFICRHLLQRGGKAYLNVPRSHDDRSKLFPHEPEGTRIFEQEEFERRLSFYQLRIESTRIWRKSAADNDEMLCYVVAFDDTARNSDHPLSNIDSEGEHHHD